MIPTKAEIRALIEKAEGRRRPRVIENHGNIYARALGELQAKCRAGEALQSPRCPLAREVPKQ